MAPNPPIPDAPRRYRRRVSTSDWEARDKDRDAAIEQVQAAWAAGRIVQADRDHRIESLRHAQTKAEVRMLVHDLQLPTEPVRTPAPADLYGSPSGYPTLAQVQAAAPAKAARSAGCIGIVVIVVAIAGLGAGIFAAVRDVSDTFGPGITGTPELPLPGAEPAAGVNVLSVSGYDDLVRAVEGATGSTTAFEAVLYPAYAVVSLPVDRSSQREERWYWDGQLEALGSRSTSSYERFDLDSVDAQVLVRLTKRVRRLVEDPTTWYAVVRHPDPDLGASLWVYASNEFNETAYLGARPDGTVVHNSTRP